MKKNILNLTTILVMVLSACIFSSCGDDKDASDLDEQSAKLVGTWQEQDQWVKDAGETTTSTVHYVRYYADGTVKDYDETFDEVMVAKWSLKDNKLRIYGTGIAETISDVTVLSTNQLCMTTNGMDFVYKKVSSTKADKYFN